MSLSGRCRLNRVGLLLAGSGLRSKLTQTPNHSPLKPDHDLLGHWFARSPLPPNVSWVVCWKLRFAREQGLSWKLIQQISIAIELRLNRQLEASCGCRSSRGECRRTCMTVGTVTSRSAATTRRTILGSPRSNIQPNITGMLSDPRSRPA